MRLSFSQWQSQPAGLRVDYDGGTYADGTLVAGTAESVVPEPLSLLLLGTGLAGVGAVRRRKPERGLE